MKIYISCLILICTILIACSKSSPTGSSSNSRSLNCTVAKTFSGDALPVFQAKCALSGCHATGSSNGPGALTTYQQIFNARSDIRNAVITGFMPQGGSLTDDQLSSIVCWIDSGAPNN
ncbi:MAG TPA: hypothetical protein VFP87_02580 [Chitinophagaceae bacterium]|nr:hypothetical protein [Chitinophagaceae bacterium]